MTAKDSKLALDWWHRQNFQIGAIYCKQVFRDEWVAVSNQKSCYNLDSYKTVSMAPCFCCLYDIEYSHRRVREMANFGMI